MGNPFKNTNKKGAFHMFLGPPTAKAQRAAMCSLNATMPKVRALEPRRSPRAHLAWILRHGSMPCDPGLQVLQVSNGWRQQPEHHVRGNSDKARPYHDPTLP
jgi:hypothetical protein